MIKSVNKLDEVKGKLRQEHKVVVMKDNDYYKTVSKMNEQLEEFRTKSLIKARNSQISASSVILTN